MGLFSMFKKEKPSADWNNAYKAAPRFYKDTDGTLFGAIGLTEGTDTILPKTPQKAYAVNGKPVPVWKMVLISTTKDDIIGDCDYFAALERLQDHILDSKADAVLLRGLSLRELEALSE